METFELNLSMKELEKRTHKDYLVTKKFLKADAPEYLALAEGDKKALKHLCKAAAIIEKINMQLDCHHNLAVKEYLEEASKKNKQAKLTKILFDAQKGVNAVDTMSSPIRLIKGIDEKLGKGVYPENLSKEEFHNVLIRMLKEGKIDDAKLLLGEFKENSCEINNYFYTQLLKDGLSEYAGKRYGTGLYEIKSPHNPDEIAILQHNKKKDYFKIIINDKDMNPKRWYFFVNDFYIKNYDPAAGFHYFKSKFGQQSDVEIIKDNLLKDLAWIKSSLKKSCKIMTEHPDYKIKLLK